MITDTSEAMLDHMERLINVSFCCDPEGRLLAVNEPEKPPPPLLHGAHAGGQSLALSL
ncbi:MAG: hypothetical protein R3E79_03060 [Caldilineaceae bacterium]